MKKSILYILAIVLVLFSSCSKNENAWHKKAAVVVDVKSLAFHKDSTLWFGGNQHIMIKDLPDSVLSITHKGDSFVWKLKEPTYVKFNGDNKHYAIPYDNITTITINGEDVTSQIKENALLKKRINEKTKDRRYTLLANVLNNPELKSLISYSKKEKLLILLDSCITVNDTIRFKNRNTGTINSNTLKINFFRTSNSSFLSPKDTAKYFHWGDTCFTTSVKSYYTPFGAKEITLTLTDKKDSIKVSFNKIYRAAIPLKAIDSAVKQNEQIPISLRQISYANTYSNEVYSQNIANPEYWEFGVIDKDYKFTIEQKSCLLKEETKSYVLNCCNFIWGLIPLFFIFVLGLVVIWLITQYSISESDNNPDNDRWKCYFIVLYFALLFLSIGRIFIGYNLSFTQPFAVYAFPTAVIVSPLILLCVLLFWILFLCMEFGIDKILEDIKRKWQRVAFVPLLFVVLVTGIYFLSKYCLGEISTFYFHDISNLSKANPLSDNNYVFATTIWGLVALSFCLTIFCTFGKWERKNHIITLCILIRWICKGYKNKKRRIKQLKNKNCNITKIFTIGMLFVIAVLFFTQQSSVSVALLITCVLLFWLSSHTKWLEIGLKQKILTKKFVKSRGLFILILFIVGCIAGCIAFFSHNSGGYIITLLSILMIMIIVIFEIKIIRRNEKKCKVRLFRKMRLSKYVLILIPLLIAGVVALAGFHDSGYIINLILFPVLMSVVLFYRYYFHGAKENDNVDSDKRLKDFFISLSVIIIVFVCSWLFAYLNAKNYDPFSSDRLTERSVAYFEFSKIQEFGYRISEERAQFFAVQTKYAYPSDYDCYEPMHPGISSFTDPVIENDLSVPFGLIYQFGEKWWRLPIAFLLIIWGVLGFVVLRMSINPKPEKANYGEKSPTYFSTYGIIRIFCMSLILSSGLWLLCSYYGVVPFTGRLIYGLGQDSIGEVFDTVFLFAFMGLCGIANDNKFTRTKK